MEFKVELEVEGNQAVPIANWVLVSECVQIFLIEAFLEQDTIKKGKFAILDVEKSNLKDYENIDYKLLYNDLLDNLLPKLERKYNSYFHVVEIPETLEIDLSKYIHKEKISE